MCDPFAFYLFSQKIGGYHLFCFFQLSLYKIFNRSVSIMALNQHLHRGIVCCHSMRTFPAQKLISTMCEGEPRAVNIPSGTSSYSVGGSSVPLASENFPYLLTYPYELTRFKIQLWIQHAWRCQANVYYWKMLGYLGDLRSSSCDFALQKCNEDPLSALLSL